MLLVIDGKKLTNHNNPLFYLTQASKGDLWRLRLRQTFCEKWGPMTRTVKFLVVSLRTVLCIVIEHWPKNKKKLDRPRAKASSRWWPPGMGHLAFPAIPCCHCSRCCCQEGERESPVPTQRSTNLEARLAGSGRGKIVGRTDLEKAAGNVNERPGNRQVTADVRDEDVC